MCHQKARSHVNIEVDARGHMTAVLRKPQWLSDAIEPGCSTDLYSPTWDMVSSNSVKNCVRQTLMDYSLAHCLAVL